MISQAIPSIRAVLCAFLAALLCGQPIGARNAASPVESLTDLSLEDLMNVEVVSVSRKEQKLVEAPSAVFVLNQEDIRRSGATSIPEALRLVPGVHVARIDANKWSVSIRGFNNRFSDKLLVMIDGRSVYNPLFGGVYWEAQEMLLEDVERIEVVRGPGGTMWGSNAVNGVVNVITKKSDATVGGLASFSAGNLDRGILAVRFGQQISEGMSYRVFSRGVKRASQFLQDGGRAPDDWSAVHGGFRFDWEPGDDSSLMVTGNLYRNNANGLVSLPVPPVGTVAVDRSSLSSGSVLTRYSKKHGERATSTLQVYFDRFRRSELIGGQKIDTVDVDFQQDRTLSNRHRLVWGGGFRVYDDSIESSEFAHLDPMERTTHLASFFVQDDFSLSDKLILSGGSKFEHNSYTGWEVQPSVSVRWNRTSRDNAWMSVSRAVRIPSRFNSDATVDLKVHRDPRVGPVLARVFGTPNFRAENLVAYEAGYRIRPAKSVSVDVAAFYNEYDDLAGNDLGQLGFDIRNGERLLVAPLYFSNSLCGRSHGVETALSWRPIQTWKLTAAHSWLQMNLGLAHGSHATESILDADSTPAQIYSFRSLWEPTRRLEFDIGYYRTGALQVVPVPAINRVDIHFGWRLTDRLEISLVGDNLLDDRHPETIPVGFDRHSEIGRGGRVQLTWGF